MRTVRRAFAIALIALFLSVFTTAGAKACMECPCLSLKKDGPCLLR